MFTEVLIFVQDGCPACGEIKQIVERICGHYGSCIRWRFVDANQENLLADVMQIQDTPTVIATEGFQPVIRLVGGQEFEPRLVGMYNQLLQNTSCSVGSWRGDV